MNLDTIYLCDCLDGLRRVPAGTIPLTLTSPPYDQLRSRYTLTPEKFRQIADQLYRVTAPGGVVVWVVREAVVRGSETGTSSEQRLHFRDLGFRLYQTLVMHRKQYRPGSRRHYGSPLEYAFVLSKGRPRTVNLLRDRPAKRPGERRIRLFAQRHRNGTIQRKYMDCTTPEFIRRHAVWEYDVGYQKTTRDAFAYAHCALMPEKMAQDHIRSWSKIGDVVLDPFCGAGTTPKMAVLEGRRFLGFEFDPEFHQLALRRVREALDGLLSA